MKPFPKTLYVKTLEDANEPKQIYFDACASKEEVARVGEVVDVAVYELKGTVKVRTTVQAEPVIASEEGKNGLRDPPDPAR